jgi:Ni2+-binding GTPase involved in maturation of urease and hydrogenase
VRRINPAIRVFKTSSKTGEGLDQWCSWLSDQIKTAIT